jgi:hypothetical protein
VSQVIRNCPECSEMNKGLSAMRQNQNQARYSQPTTTESRQLSSTPRQQLNSTQQHMSPTPPIDIYNQLQSSPRPESPSRQLQQEAVQQNAFQQFPQTSGFDLPVDPALMEGLQSDASLADLPPSPFLTAGESADVAIPQMGHLESSVSDTSNPEKRAPTAREEMRRRLNRVAAYGQQ